MVKEIKIKIKDFFIKIYRKIRNLDLLDILDEQVEKYQIMFTEMLERRDEVLKRAKLVIKKEFPDYLLEEGMGGILEWMVQPHINEDYEKYTPKNYDEIDRGAERAVITIMKKMVEDDKENEIEIKKE